MNKLLTLMASTSMIGWLLWSIERSPAARTTQTQSASRASRAQYATRQQSHRTPRGLKIKPNLDQRKRPSEQQKHPSNEAVPLFFTKQLRKTYDPSFVDIKTQMEGPEVALTRLWQNILPTRVRRKVPLSYWSKNLPVVSSPRLLRCRAQLLHVARKGVGRLRHFCRLRRSRKKMLVGSDCSGWIRCLFFTLGIDTHATSKFRGKSGTFHLYHFFQKHGMLHRGTPLPGDVVFWHATIDRNRNGRLWDDPLTHVGIIHAIDSNGRLRILHTGFHRRPRVHEIYMHLGFPLTTRRKIRGRWQTTNSYLVKRRIRDRGEWGWTTAQLFAGFGTLRYCSERLSP